MIITDLAQLDPSIINISDTIPEQQGDSSISSMNMLVAKQEGNSISHMMNMFAKPQEDSSMNNHNLFPKTEEPDSKESQVVKRQKRERDIPRDTPIMPPSTQPLIYFNPANIGAGAIAAPNELQLMTYGSLPTGDAASGPVPGIPIPVAYQVPNGGYSGPQGPMCQVLVDHNGIPTGTLVPASAPQTTVFVGMGQNGHQNPMNMESPPPLSPGHTTTIPMPPPGFDNLRAPGFPFNHPHHVTVSQHQPVVLPQDQPLFAAPEERNSLNIPRPSALEFGVNGVPTSRSPALPGVNGRPHRGVNGKPPMIGPMLPENTDPRHGQSLISSTRVGRHNRKGRPSTPNHKSRRNDVLDNIPKGISTFFYRS